MFKNQITPESFEKKSDEILSVFTKTAKVAEDKEVIAKKQSENETFEARVGKNTNFINKLNALFE